MQRLGNLAEIIRKRRPESAQEVYETTRKIVIAPWEETVSRRPNIRTPHWNFNLEKIWKSMRRAGNRATRSGLIIDWEIYKESRTELEKENRRARRMFKSRTEKIQSKG